MEYLFLGLAIALVLGFEFINGFHDTANAVVTVIYTNTMKPVQAVIYSGLCNLAGVMVSSGTVAFAIISLLPPQLLTEATTSQSLVMVIALLLSAIAWNLGTWYVGLPISSTHTLIGTILGINLASSISLEAISLEAISLSGEWWQSPNWLKMQEVLLSLLISPLVGFGGAVLLFLMIKSFVKNHTEDEDLANQPNLHPQSTDPQSGDSSPTFWQRSLLILTCGGVSFAHGSNDGQKGMGLMMLILVAMLPSLFAVNINASPALISQLRDRSLEIIPVITSQIDLASDSPNLSPEASLWRSLQIEIQDISRDLATIRTFTEIDTQSRQILRRHISLVTSTINDLDQRHRLDHWEAQDLLRSYGHQLEQVIQFVPIWVKVAIAISLGLGTMIGWKRVVVTVGEKIGNTELNYAQGATAEIVTVISIAIADHWGLPVSTTHILSSGIAGSMIANRSGLQMQTIKNLLLAWALTLPVCILLGFSTYLAVVMLVRT